MPTYDYQCPANGQIFEVKHRISETVSTWGELCALTGMDCGDLPANSAVNKLANGGQVVSSSSLGNPTAPACASGPCCGRNMCDF